MVNRTYLKNLQCVAQQAKLPRNCIIHYRAQVKLFEVDSIIGIYLAF